MISAWKISVPIEKNSLGSGHRDQQPDHGMAKQWGTPRWFVTLGDAGLLMLILSRRYDHY
jgi:hypothetical protein